MAVVRDLVVDAGSTVRVSLTWRQTPLPTAPVGTPGPPYDLNSATARMQMRRKKDRTGELLLDLDEHGAPGESGIYLGGSSGQVVINITADDTRNKLGITRRAFYDLFITLASGEVHKVIQGKVKIGPNVTDPSTTFLAVGSV